MVAAFDAASGKSLWRNRTKFAFAGGPAVDGDLLVAGTLNGEVLAYDAGTGAERWNVSVSAEVISAAGVALDTVVVRSNDGHLYGLDGTSGARKWVFDRNAVPLLSLRGNAAP